MTFQQAWPAKVLHMWYASARYYRKSCCSNILRENLGDCRAFRVLLFVRARDVTPSCFKTSEYSEEFWRWS